MCIIRLFFIQKKIDLTTQQPPKIQTLHKTPISKREKNQQEDNPENPSRFDLSHMICTPQESRQD